MTDCPNVEIREALPDLVHGALPAPVRESVEAHVRTCEACAAELAIVEAVLASAPAPVVDTGRISASIPAYGRTREGVAMGFGARHFAALRIAAAVVVAVGIGALAVARQWPSGSSRGALATPGVTVESAARLPSGSGDRGIALVGTADLSDDNLAQLIAAMDRVEAVPPESPPPVTITPTGDGGV